MRFNLTLMLGTVGVLSTGGKEPDNSGELHAVRMEKQAAHEEISSLTLEIVHLKEELDSRVQGLELAHILALRLYTSGAFSSINNPLRAGCSSANPYPFPTLMVYLSEALKLLRTSELRNNRQTMGGRRLYRGLRNIAVPENFLEYGGTERAPMSSSSDRDVALKFALSGDAVSSLLLTIEADNFMCCGADVNFVSVFPVEAEFLYPPGMFLFPKSDVQKEEVRVPGTEQMKVVDVLEVRVYFPT